MKKNCCGIQSYKDWSTSGYGNASYVPESCCLLFGDDCNRNVINSNAAEDEVLTNGCLPTILAGIEYNIGNPIMGILRPLVIIHTILLLIVIIIFANRNEYEML